jgi:hypothetical protein
MPFDTLTSLNLNPDDPYTSFKLLESVVWDLRHTDSVRIMSVRNADFGQSLSDLDRALTLVLQHLELINK